MKKMIATGLLALTILPSFAAVNNSAQPFVPIFFTEDEKAQHLQDSGFIAEETARCLQEKLYEHQDFYKQWGISPFFGDQSRYAKLVYKNGKDGEQYPEAVKISRKEDHLRSIGYSNAEEMVKRIKPVSCVGLALKCLEYGFKSVGEDVIWSKVKAYARSYDNTGMSIQHALQQIGWKVLYWNPDTSRNAEWDKIDQSIKPNNARNYWGQHSYVYKVSIQRNQQYYQNHVDNTTFLADFNESPPREFKNIPFFLGVAHLGYHVFPGYYGTVIEGHSSMALKNFKTIETSEFNPLATGGGPRGRYLSGIIAVPPGYVTEDGSAEDRRISNKIIDYIWFNVTN